MRVNTVDFSALSLQQAGHKNEDRMISLLFPIGYMTRQMSVSHNRETKQNVRAE